MTTARLRLGRARAAARAAVAGMLLVAAVAAALAGPGASPARADADPGSAALVSQSLYLPPDAHASPSAQARLHALLRAAARAGFPLHVAVIPSEYDLGSVTAVWRRPRSYARFLSAILSHTDRRPMLAVMPDGFGFSWPGHATAGAQRRLSRISIGSGSAGLIAATATAVRALAGADHHAIAPVAPSAPAPRAAAARRGVATHGAGAPGAGAHGLGDARIAGIAIAALALAAGLATLAVRGRRHWRDREGGHAVLTRRRWAVPGLAVLGCTAAGLPILILGVVRDAPAKPGISVGGLGTPYTWQPGRRRAAGFRLTGENGRPVSPAMFRGRPLIITFVDPLCRNLCPLAAHVLNQVDDDLPGAQRPAILAVSVNVHGDSRATLRQDDRMWGLVAQWHWAIGSRRSLGAVWNRYDVGVSDTRATVAGVTFNSINHDEVAYLIDRSGNVRAMYGWPFYAQNVEVAVRRLGSS